MAVIIGRLCKISFPEANLVLKVMVVFSAREG